MSVVFGNYYGNLPTPTRDGYTFKGWYTEESGGSKITATTIVEIARDHTLYAQWETKTYTVTFDANGGSVNKSSMTVTYDATYGDLPTPDGCLRNTQGLQMAFDLERTSNFSSNDNISYGEYIAAKQKTLEKYLKRVEEFAAMSPKAEPQYYIRADFTNWQINGKYAMTAEDGVFVLQIVANKQVRLKVYNSVSDAWYGTECMAENCAVAYETDEHSNIVLSAGTYRIVFDQRTNRVTVENE